MPAIIARQHIPGLDIDVDPCAAILVLIVTGLLCVGIKEVYMCIFFIFLYLFLFFIYFILFLNFCIFQFLYFPFFPNSFLPILRNYFLHLEC